MEKINEGESNFNLNKIVYDNPNSVREKLKLVTKGSNSKKLHDLKFRLDQLKKLRAALIKFEKEIHYSNLQDIGQKEFASWAYCLVTVKGEIDHIIDHLMEWASPRSVETPFLFLGSKSYVIPEPFGVCLVMGAWNQQYTTLIMPLATALAAGNCIVAKPSEMAEVSAVVCEKILSELDPEVVQVIQGGAEVCVEILQNKTDLIIFTGSAQKGVLVAKAAAEFLTPCILELGGQNPAIIDKSADLEATAYSLIQGRCLGSGQICLAPEYLLVENDIFEELKSNLIKVHDAFFQKNPKNSEDYCRIINDFHTERIIKLIDTHGGKLILGGEHDLKEKYISPTLISFESMEKMAQSPLSVEEIFGPIMYMAPYKTLDSAIQYINNKDKPLSLYYYGKNHNTKERVIKETSSGALVVNDSLIHFIQPYLPFGGVGKSGYGACHGKFGFDNVSHLKPVLETPGKLIKFKYPPFTERSKMILSFMIDKVRFTHSKALKTIFLTTAIVSLFIFRNKIVSYLPKLY